MPNFPGVATARIIPIIQTVMSGNVSGYSKTLVSPPLLAAAGLRRGTFSPGSPSRIHWSTQGLAKGSFGDLLFDRIIILPPTVTLPNVLTRKQWEVEVWNTHLRERRDLTGLAITGAGGLQVTGPTSMSFYPGQSQLYTATLTTSGPAAIANVAHWTFAGEPDSSMEVFGKRLMVFSARIDWSEPFREKPCWKTSVLPGWNTAEQRIRMRSKPRVDITFRVVALTATEAQLLENTLYRWGSNLYGVPVWSEKTWLTVDMPVGALSFQAAVADLPSFEPGGLALMWKDPFTFESFQVSSIAGSLVVVGSPALAAWPAGTVVVPLRPGRLMENPQTAEPTNWIQSGTFHFSGERL